jgi:hypothetical protein
MAAIYTSPLVAAKVFSINNQFVIDESREKFILTYAPSGFQTSET